LGIDEHDLEWFVFEKVVKGLPVIAGGLHHHERHLLGDQVLSKGEDLIGDRTPGRDRRFGFRPAGAGDADAYFGIALRDIDPGALGMDYIYCFCFFFGLLDCPPRGGQGDFRSLMLVLDGNIPRFPWEPSTIMLTYRLASTTEAFGVLPGRTLLLWFLMTIGIQRRAR
jgi:hypothetical protein